MKSWGVIKLQDRKTDLTDFARYMRTHESVVRARARDQKPALTSIFAAIVVVFAGLII